MWLWSLLRLSWLMHWCCGGGCGWAGSVKCQETKKSTTDHVLVKIISQVIRAHPQQITWFVVISSFACNCQLNHHHHHSINNINNNCNNRNNNNNRDGWTSTQRVEELKSPRHIKWCVLGQLVCFLLVFIYYFTNYGFWSRQQDNKDSTSQQGHEKSMGHDESMTTSTGTW